MSKRKIKRSKKEQAQILHTTQKKPGRIKRTLLAIKKRTLISSSFVTNKTVNAGQKVKELVSNIRAGEKLADDCAQVAEYIKVAADKADLFAAVKTLRTQANLLETIAKSK